MFHVGLALVFFGYAPHIAFIQRLTGLGWPALPDLVMYLAARRPPSSRCCWPSVRALILPECGHAYPALRWEGGRPVMAAPG